MLPLLKRYWHFLALLAALLIGYLAGRGRADERAARANAAATAAAAQATAAEAAADTALAHSAAAEAALRPLRSDRAAALARLADLKYQLAHLEYDSTVTITEDSVWVDATEEFELLEQSLAAAEEVIASDSVIIRTLTADRAQLTSALTISQNALGLAKQELLAQSHRTERAPRKILGLLPLPQLSVGYGAALHQGAVILAPVASLGFRIAL